MELEDEAAVSESSEELDEQSIEERLKKLSEQTTKFVQKIKNEIGRVYMIAQKKECLDEADTCAEAAIKSIDAQIQALIKLKRNN